MLVQSVLNRGDSVSQSAAEIEGGGQWSRPEVVEVETVWEEG